MSKKLLFPIILLLSMSMSAAESITSIVVDAINQQPVSQVKIWLDSINFCYSDANGRFVLDTNNTMKGDKSSSMIILEHPNYLTAARSIIGIVSNPTTQMYLKPDNTNGIKKTFVNDQGTADNQDGPLDALSTGFISTKKNTEKDSIVTPFGKRIHKSHAHQISRNHAMDFSEGYMREVDQTNNIIKNFGKREQPKSQKIEPASTNGWVTCAYWTNNTGLPTLEFGSAWMVPPLSSTYNDQLIYLFNGIQTNENNILQPVMQYGFNGGWGGNYWVIASWYVYNGEPTYSDQVVLTPGDIIVGKMTRTAQSGSNFSYLCRFEGIPQTNLQINNITELVWNALALEFYKGDCNEYPKSDYMSFFNTYISTGTGTWPSITWTPLNRNINCNERTRILKNGNGNTSAAISWYKDHFIFTDPKNTGCTSYDWYKGDINNSNTVSYSSTNSGFSPSSRVRLAMSRETGKVIAVAPPNKIQVGNISSSGECTWTTSTTIPNIQGVDEVIMNEYGFVVVFYVNSSGVPLYCTGRLPPNSNSVTWYQYNIEFKLKGDISIYVQPGGNFFAADFGSFDDLRIAMVWKSNNDVEKYYNAYLDLSNNLIACDQFTCPQISHGTLLNLDIAYNRMGSAFIVQNELNGSAYNTWITTKKDGSSTLGSFLKLSNRRSGRIGSSLDNGLLFSKASTDKTGYLNLIQSNFPAAPSIIKTVDMGSCKRVDNDPLHCDLAF